MKSGWWQNGVKPGSKRSLTINIPQDYLLNNDFKGQRKFYFKLTNVKKVASFSLEDTNLTSRYENFIHSCWAVDDNYLITADFRLFHLSFSDYVPFALLIHYNKYYDWYSKVICEIVDILRDYVHCHRSILNNELRQI